MASLVTPLVLLVILINVHQYNVAALDASAEVTGLPGQPSVSFKHYAGHIPVGKDRQRALFYWFFEADQRSCTQQQLQQSLPLAVWFNGGPGCSSIGNGALSELGPFFTNRRGDGLVINPYSWTKEANIIFVESPFAVGFSYSNVTADYDEFNDAAIAEDAYSFLLGWFDKFPEYKSNDFYLLGESYAGHYIPTLAQVIVEQNKLAQQQHRNATINFKGFAIGNPWTDAAFDNEGTTDFYRSHSLISDETYEAIQANCDYAKELPVDAASNNTICSDAVADADNDMAEINIYDIYAESCNRVSNATLNSRRRSAYHLTAAYVNPCADTVTPYLNMADVQKALHASDAPVIWSACSSVVYSHYKRDDITASMLPVYQGLLKEGLKIWIYSGDVDGVVATSATRKWIKALKLPVEKPWYPWNYGNQVGGWTQKYSSLTFTTVRGAGHMVPATKPAQALALFKSFLAGDMLPSF